MSQWQPIETAPKNGRIILVAFPILSGAAKGQMVVGESQWCDGGYWEGFHRPDKEQPTHWMPLPDPPDVAVSGADRR